MRLLEGKTAIITGASSGIGRAIAMLFARQGAGVVAVARSEDKLKSLVEEIACQGGEAIYSVGDVAHEETAKEAVNLAITSFGKLDVAINNAAMLGPAVSVEQLSYAEWQHVLNVNLSSAFLGAKYQLPALHKNKGGSLVFVSSFIGHTVGLPNMAAYAASKAGMIGLTKALAIESAAYGIRVNALLPGGTDTPMGHEASSTPDAMAFAESIHAFKRLAKAEEIAKAALFLASDDASFCTGSTLLVEGGVSICKT